MCRVFRFVLVFVVCYVLFAVCWLSIGSLLLFVWCLFFVVCCIAVRCLLVVRCFGVVCFRVLGLLVPCGMMLFVGCCCLMLLVGVRCVLLVVRCSLCLGCCSSCVVVWLVFVGVFVVVRCFGVCCSLLLFNVWHVWFNVVLVFVVVRISLFVACWFLVIDYRLFLVVLCFFVLCVLFVPVVCCSLIVAFCLFVAISCCSWLVARCLMLFLVCCWWFVLLLVVRWSLLVVCLVYSFFFCFFVSSFVVVVRSPSPILFVCVRFACCFGVCCLFCVYVCDGCFFVVRCLVVGCSLFVVRCCSSVVCYLLFGAC